METFSSFITEEKNVHLTHIEDSVIYGGVNGAREAINALRALRDMLAGHHNGGGRLTIKFDGAPAVFAGIDPTDGKFFVAKKGIFNKNPKVYKTESEVDDDTSGDLADKLKLALRYLPEIGIKGVIQGDFLFSNGDLSTRKIDGMNYLTFHPNTLIYALPADSQVAKVIKQAKIGIVWHTSYSGRSFETMKASYGVDIKKLKSSRNVWSIGANLPDMTNATMTAKETDEVTSYLSTAGKLFNQISGSTLRQLESDPILNRHIETFNNSFVRAGTIVTDTRKHVSDLIRWIENRYKKEIEARKSEKGKASQQQKLDSLLDFFSADNRKSLENLFELQKVLVLAKLRLIAALEKLKEIDTFVKTPNGYKVTGHEGYVAIDRLGKNAVKVVDRMEFSYNNFSPDVLKGWSK